MVQVDGRIFARSWGKSERSWFTTLLKEPATGQIKFGDRIINITGVPCKDTALNRLIDKAYLERYTTPENIPYAQGISQPEYADYGVGMSKDEAIKYLKDRRLYAHGRQGIKSRARSYALRRAGKLAHITVDDFDKLRREFLSTN